MRKPWSVLLESINSCFGLNGMKSRSFLSSLEFFEDAVLKHEDSIVQVEYFLRGKVNICQFF